MSFVTSFCRRVFMITRSKTNSIKYPVTHDPKNKSFNVDFGEGKGVVQYELEGNALDLYTSHIPENLRGKGYGKILAKVVLDHIAANNQKMILTCHFLKRYYEANKSIYQQFVIEN